MPVILHTLDQVVMGSYLNSSCKIAGIHHTDGLIVGCYIVIA